MKRMIMVVAASAMMFVAACGGSSSGGGGLVTSEVSKVYEFDQEGDMVSLALVAFLEQLNAGCPTGAAAQIDVDATTACEGGGTTSIGASVTCSKSVPDGDGTYIITIASMTGGLIAADGCISTASYTEGETTSTYTVTQDGATSQFVFSDGTTITVTPTESDPVIVLNGSAVIGEDGVSLTYALQGSAGMTTATMQFTQHYTFDRVSVGTNNPTCAADAFTATEGTLSGSCTVQTDCETCQ